MGADEEVLNIYYSIYNINLTLVNFDQSLGQLVDGMNFGLSVFDQHVDMIVENVNDVQNKVNSKLKLFPSEWTYLIILTLIFLILLGLVGYLLYCVSKYVLNRHEIYEEYRMWYLKNVMKRNFDDWGEDDEFTESCYSISDDTPPPTYNEYVQTADLYANYHDEIEAQRRSGQQFSFRLGRTRGTGEEYNTLI